MQAWGAAVLGGGRPSWQDRESPWTVVGGDERLASGSPEGHGHMGEPRGERPADGIRDPGRRCQAAKAGVRREEPSAGEGDDVRKVPSESSTVCVAGGSGAGAWGAEA